MPLVSPETDASKIRTAALLVIALVVSVLFFNLIQNFVIALLMAAVIAGLAYPLYSKLVSLLGGREKTASALTVLFIFGFVVVPLLIALLILVEQAILISQTAGPWVTAHIREPILLEEAVDKLPMLKRLLPYQEQILAKAGELAGTLGGYVAHGLAAATVGTAEFFLMLFITLYACFYFLIDGRQILDGMLRYLPLTPEDKGRLLGTFTSVSRASIKGSLIIGAVQGGLAGLAFWAAGIHGTLFWATVMAVLSAVPGIGAPLVWVPAVIYLAMIGETWSAIGVAAWCAFVVGTVDNMLRPILVGKDTEMPDLLVLLTTLGGVIVFGAVGIIIGPIIGALFTSIWALWGTAMEDAGHKSMSSPEAVPEQSIQQELLQLRTELETLRTGLEASGTAKHSEE